jgi:hypothetical protein
MTLVLLWATWITNQWLDVKNEVSNNQLEFRELKVRVEMLCERQKEDKQR